MLLPLLFYVIDKSKNGSKSHERSWVSGLFHRQKYKGPKGPQSQEIPHSS